MSIKIDKRLLRKGIGNMEEPLTLIGNWDKQPRPEEEALAMPALPKEIKRHPDSKSEPKEKKVKVKFLKDTKAAPDHIHIREYKTGETHEILESLAMAFIKKRIAKKINNKSEVKNE